MKKLLKLRLGRPRKIIETLNNEKQFKNLNSSSSTQCSKIRKEERSFDNIGKFGVSV